MESNKRQLQKENTRKKIIESAYRLYAEKGFTTTTSAVAKEADVSHGTIFVHFPTLDDLLACLLQNFGDTVGTTLHSLAEGNRSVEDFLKTHIAVLEEYEDFYRRLITEISLLPDEAKTTFIFIQSTVSFHFSKVVEQEIQQKAIKNLPVHMLFNTWIGLVNYYLQNKELFAPDASVLKRYKSELIRVFLKLIKI